MVRVAAHAEADELGVDLRAARCALFVFLEHDRAGALRHHEAVAVAGPTAGSRAAGSSLRSDKRAGLAESCRDRAA